MKNFLVKKLFVFCTFLFFTACQTDHFNEGHQIGFQEGFKQGFSHGKADGYILGKKDGYDSGYLNGTFIIVKKKWVPTVAGTLLIFITCIMLILLYVLLQFKIKLICKKWKEYLEMRSNFKTKTKYFTTFKSKGTKPFILIAGVLSFIVVVYTTTKIPLVFNNETKPQVSSYQKSQDLAKVISADLVINGPQLIEAAEKTELGDNKPFNDGIYNLGAKLNQSLEISLCLTADQKTELDESLKEHYPEIGDEIRKAYLAGIKNLPNKPVRTVSSTEYSTRAEILSGVINSFICSWSNLVFEPLKIHLSLGASIAACYFLQDPCETLLAGVTDYIGQIIYEAGIIKDIEVTRSNLIMQKTTALCEVATYENDMDIEMSRVINRNISNLLSWQAARLTIYFQAAVKYGYDLSSGFEIEINEQKRQIIVSLPEPKALSTCLEPVLTDVLDDGVPDLTSSDFWQLYKQAKDNAIQQSENSNIKKDAEVQIKTMLTYIFQPFINNLKYPYILKFLTKNYNTKN